MAKLTLHNLRRLRYLSSSSSIILSRSLHSQIPNSLLSSSPLTLINSSHQSRPNPNVRNNSLAFSNFTLTRSFSIHSSIDNDENEGVKLDKGGDGVVEELVSISGGGGGDEHWYDLFVGTLTSLLDGYHYLTGLPWWVVISLSTLFLRLTLLPVHILQLKKMKTVSEFLPKLRPPFPPPLSGKSYIEHFLLFRKERRAIGCPSYMWSLVSATVQVPFFLLWMTTIRGMSLNNYPEFESGGTLWFQNLTELPHGMLAPVFPLLIAGLHYLNVKRSFKTSMVEKGSGPVRLLAKYYKLYLEILVIPIFLVGFYIPQGCLIYWSSNSSLTVIQHFFLNHVTIREKLGLPDNTPPVKSEIPERTGLVEQKKLAVPLERRISVENLSPKELLSLSVQFLAKGLQDKAIPLLRLALEKDPGYVRASVVMGQTLMQKGMLVEATEYFDSAISKLFLNGFPIEVEDVDLLIIASTWAGSTCIRQGKNPEGLEHLQRIADMKEPEDPKSKAHYFDGLIFLASALINKGRKDEAAQYLRIAAAYDPAYNVYLHQCLEDTENSNEKRN